MPTYGSTQQHTLLGSIHAIKGHMVKWYHMCVQLGHGFHKQAKHFNSTTPPQHQNTTPVGFEPTRGDPIGLAGRRLNRSAKVSLALQGRPFHLQSEFPLRIFATATTGGKRQVVTRSTKTLGAPFCKNKLQHAFQKIAERDFDPRTFGL